MTITKIKSISLDEIEPGETFYYDGDLYIKLYQEYEDYQAVRLKDGFLERISVCESVQRVNAEIRVKES